MTLEERVLRLEDIEAIRYLQAKYQRCLDTRDFDGVAECFAEDAESSYGDGKMAYHGKEEIIKFLCKVMSLNMPSTHLIHGGEIDILDSSNAKAQWYLEDFLQHKIFFVKLHGAAIYNVVYTKIDGAWKIKSIGYKRCYEYFELRGLINLFSLRKTNFLKEARRKDPESLGKYGKYFLSKIWRNK